MKNIIHITLGKANPNRSNGVNKVVNSIATHQVKNGFNVALWGISHSTKHNYPKRNYTTILFKDSKLKFKLDPNLKKAILNINPINTAVHLHGAFLPQLYAVARLLTKSNIPYFFTPHGAYNIQALKKSRISKQLYILLFERFLVNNASGIQLIGNSEKVGTIRYFKNNIHLIPNGQEITKTALRIPAKKSQLTLGFLGRIDITTKGLDLLIDALKLAKGYANIQLNIIGEGGDMVTLRKLINQAQLNKEVVLKGALYGADKTAALQELDALCLTSRNEGLPGVILEAASLGVPVIVSHPTNMVPYVKKYNAGWIIENNTPLGICKTILSCNSNLNKQSFINYGARAKQMVAETFDWNEIVNQLNKAYAVS